mmetsp:Transcript_6185/g.15056  ORF Transcript_6185/g.15056 Transcript_6185/m.15056 type:complete len:439 (+) Transcript_6185:107-1423(+)
MHCAWPFALRSATLTTVDVCVGMQGWRLVLLEDGGDVLRVALCRQDLALVEHLDLLARKEGVHLVEQRAVADAEHADSEQGRVGRVVDRHARHGDSARHLDNRQKRVGSVLAGGLDGHADDGNRRHGCHHAGEVRGAARASDDHLDAAVRRRARVVVHPLGGAVRGDDGELVRHPEFLENVGRSLHDGKVGVAAHDDAHLGCGLASGLALDLSDAVECLDGAPRAHRDVPHLAVLLDVLLPVPVHRCPRHALSALAHVVAKLEALRTVRVTQHVQHHRCLHLEAGAAEGHAHDRADVVLELAAVVRLDRVVSGVVRPRRDLVEDDAAVLHQEQLHAVDSAAAEGRHGFEGELLSHGARLLGDARGAHGDVADRVALLRLDDGVRQDLVGAAHNHDSQLHREFSPPLRVAPAVGGLGKGLEGERGVRGGLDHVVALAVV